MKRDRLDLPTRITRLIKFVELLEQGHQTKTSAKVCLVPPCSLRVLVEQKFVETTGVRAGLKVVKVHPMDEAALQLMAEEIWKEANKPPTYHIKTSSTKSLPPILETPLPPFLPLTILEDVSKHIASIASLLGVQCSSKTPPGMAQVIIRQQVENAQLKQKLVQSEQELQDAKKALKKVAQGMREQADKFDNVEKKIAPSEEDVINAELRERERA